VFRGVNRGALSAGAEPGPRCGAAATAAQQRWSGRGDREDRRPQRQQPNDPYLALNARLAEFPLADLTAAIEDRRLVRSCLLRATQHLSSGLRPPIKRAR
jgi:hypothetical protein